MFGLSKPLCKQQQFPAVGLVEILTFIIRSVKLANDCWLVCPFLIGRPISGHQFRMALCWLVDWVVLSMKNIAGLVAGLGLDTVTIVMRASKKPIQWTFPNSFLYPDIEL